MSQNPSVTDSQKWLRRIEKRYEELSQKWLSEARKVVKKYEGEEKERTPFNILYSNTQTLLPALYNSTPRAEVARRYTQVDPQQKDVDSAVSQVIERFCEYSADTNHGDYETYSEATQYAVLNSLVPGLGNVRVRAHVAAGYQQICYEAVQYDRFVWPKTRKWSGVNWVAFGHDLRQAEFEQTYSEFAAKAEYRKFDWDSLEQDADFEDDGPDKAQRSTNALLVWEVWDADARVVRHLCNKWPDEQLLEEPYPERLTAKFPCPQPLMYARKLNEAAPVIPYKMYEAKAEELNRITGRMMRIVKALRVRGIYNSTNPELQALFEEDTDNILIPSESAAAFQDGIDKAIWFMPVDMLVQTLNELYIAQQNCLQTIYQIMGISDIQRGATDPNETAKAQEIKNSWGGLRTKMHQKTVQTFCRDLFRISVEMAASYFAPATWAAVTKVPLLFNQQKQQLQMAQMQYQRQVQDMQQMAAMQAQQAQAQGLPPPQQPPQPPPPPISPLQQFLLTRPTWEQVIGIISDNFERTYRIDVETNSTIDLEATEDKQAIAEFMNAFGQMMAGLQPLLDSGVLPFEAAKAFMMEVTKRFRFGRQVETVLDQMGQPGQKQDPGAKEEQHAAELERVRAESAKRLAEAEQTFTNLNEELQRTKTELHATKASKELEVKDLSVQHKDQVRQIKSDYQGKMMLKDIQTKQKEGEVQQEQAGMNLSQLLAEFRTEIADMVNEAKAAAAQDGLSKQESAMAQALQKQQQDFVAAMQALVKSVSGKRKTTLLIGEDGEPIGTVSELEE